LILGKAIYQTAFDQNVLMDSGRRKCVQVW